MLLMKLYCRKKHKQLSHPKNSAGHHPRSNKNEWGCSTIPVFPDLNKYFGWVQCYNQEPQTTITITDSYEPEWSFKFAFLGQFSATFSIKCKSDCSEIWTGKCQSTPLTGATTLTSFHWSLRAVCISFCLHPRLSLSLRVTLQQTDFVSQADLGWDRKKRVADVLLYRRTRGGKLISTPLLQHCPSQQPHTPNAMLITVLSYTRRWISRRLRRLPTGTHFCFRPELSEVKRREEAHLFFMAASPRGNRRLPRWLLSSQCVCVCVFVCV